MDKTQPYEHKKRVFLLPAKMEKMGLYCRIKTNGLLKYTLIINNLCQLIMTNAVYDLTCIRPKQQMSLTHYMMIC